MVDVAILPILAGAGVEGYRRPFGESINSQADSLYGAEHVVRWDAAMPAINGAGLSGQYGDAISIYRETSILPSDILLEIGRAVKSRYLLVVTLNPPTSNSRQKYSMLTGSVYTEQNVGVDAYGQVWDAVEGDIVWEGVGAARATSIEFTYVKDRSIDTYSAPTARALATAVVGR